MTAMLELSLALSVAVGGIVRPVGRWISEHSHTERQRNALNTLERLAVESPSAASLVADVVRATQRKSASTGVPPSPVDQGVIAASDWRQPDARSE
jgi:hypothetical protein